MKNIRIVYFVLCIISNILFAATSTDVSDLILQAKKDDGGKAQLKLAICYLNGNGVEKDLQKAIYWGKIADGNYERISKFVVEIATTELKTNINIKDVISEVIKKAENGDAHSQYLLGGYYAVGYGVKQNSSEAVKWITASAKQGYLMAQYFLGVFYKYGYGVPKSNRKAILQFQIPALAQNHKESQHEIVFCENRYTFPEGRESAKTLLLKSAEQGYPPAQYDYPKYIVDPDNFKGFDHSEIFKWHLKAAEQGYARAQYSVGYSYIRGKGCVKNKKEGAKWLKLAAEQRHCFAEYMIGLCYQTGEGVNRDLKEAIKWYNEAVEQKGAGWTDAAIELGACYVNEIGVTKDLAKAFSLYKLVSDESSGSVESAILTGYCYYNGIGVGKNLEESVSYFRKATEHLLEDRKYKNSFNTIYSKNLSFELSKAFKNWEEWINESEEYVNINILVLQMAKKLNLKK